MSVCSVRGRRADFPERSDWVLMGLCTELTDIGLRSIRFEYRERHGRTGTNRHQQYILNDQCLL